jgi:hypothetical protein
MQLAEARFNRDGFVFIPGFLDPSTRLQLRELIPRIIDSAAIWRQSGEHLWFLQDDLPALDRLLRTPSLLERLDRACDLKGEPLELLAVTLYSRNPGEPGTAWHQDARFIASDSLEALSVWIPLQAMDAMNSPLKFMAGSHRHCLLHQPQAAVSAPIGLPERSPTMAAPMAFGDATVHTPWTLHASSSNRSPIVRHALIVNWLRAPLTRNPQTSLHGYGHSPVVNSLRDRNDATLKRRLQQAGIRISPSQWRHGDR